MLSRAGLVTLLVAAGGVVGAGAAVAQSGGVDCARDGICRIAAESAGGGGSSSGGSGDAPTGGSGDAGGGPPAPTGCRTHQVDDPASLRAAEAQGVDVGAGPVSSTVCDGPGRYSYVEGYSTPAGPAPAPVDPAVLAKEAIEQMQLGAPAIRMSAPPDRGFVGVPVWLWVERGPTKTGPQTESAAAGQVTVTATASVERTEWTMGPPREAVICRGPGTPWAGQSGMSPDCGYVYEQRSLPERTSGSGRWPITATNVWTVEWSGGGASGSETVRLSSDASLAVGEIQVVTDGSGGR